MINLPPDRRCLCCGPLCSICTPPIKKAGIGSVSLSRPTSLSGPAFVIVCAAPAVPKSSLDVCHLKRFAMIAEKLLQAFIGERMMEQLFEHFIRKRHNVYARFGNLNHMQRSAHRCGQALAFCSRSCRRSS